MSINSITLLHGKDTTGMVIEIEENEVFSFITCVASEYFMQNKEKQNFERNQSIHKNRISFLLKKSCRQSGNKGI